MSPHQAWLISDAIGRRAFSKFCKVDPCSDFMIINAENTVLLKYVVQKCHRYIEGHSTNC